MSIKLVLLKSGETLISDIKELVSEEKICGYIYENDKESFEELEYDSLESWTEECELGNEGFGFNKDELEILEDGKQ